MNENELQHFGVPGMRWGFRKKPESTGVTSARQALHDRAKDLNDSDAVVAKSYKHLSPSGKKELMRAHEGKILDLKYADQDLKSQKILDKLNSRPKSKDQLKLEERYKSKGMNDDEAAVAAYVNIRTQRTFANVGSLALAASMVLPQKKNIAKYVVPTLITTIGAVKIAEYYTGRNLQTEKYRKEHPDSKMSYTEVSRMLDRQSLDDFHR